MLVYFLGLCFLWKLDLLSLWESSKKKVLESVLSFRRQTRLRMEKVGRTWVPFFYDNFG